MAAPASELGVPVVKLGSQGLHVSKQGLGCAAMCGCYGPTKHDDEIISLIRHSVSRGVTFLDTAEVYGPFTNEILVGKGTMILAIKGMRDKVQLATKFGIDTKVMMNVHGDLAYVRAACEASLKRLDVDCIDLYYQHRVDISVPIEVTVGEMKELVAEGKVKYIGLSEASAETIRRAHAVHPITAVQIEWSLWTRDVEEEIIPVCRELGIGIVAYSPLGTGFLASGAKALENALDNDFRKALPRFQAENLENNEVIYENLSRVASKKGCWPAQLALAWLYSQGDVVPIPGTSQLKNLEDKIGALSVNLTSEDIQEVESTVLSVVSGESYPETWKHWTWKGSDTPPLSSWNA